MSTMQRGCFQSALSKKKLKLKTKTQLACVKSLCQNDSFFLQLLGQISIHFYKQQETGGVTTPNTTEGHKSAIFQEKILREKSQQYPTIFLWVGFFGLFGVFFCFVFFFFPCVCQMILMAEYVLRFSCCLSVLCDKITAGKRC